MQTPKDISNDNPATRATASTVGALSLIVALLMALASLAGLLFQAALYPAEELRQSFVSNDVVNLFIGLPILLGSLALAQRQRLIGLLFWPGALFYVTYNSIAYAVALRFTGLGLVHLVLVGLSLYTIVKLFLQIDATAIRQRLAGAVPERLAGGALAGLGALFFVWRGSLLVQSLSGAAVLPGPELAVVVADLLITPAWIAGGILLWRRQALGYLSGAGLLFQASMLFVALLVFFILQPFVAAAPFPLADFIAIFVMGLVSFVPFGLFVRGIRAAESRG